MSIEIVMRTGSRLAQSVEGNEEPSIDFEPDLTILQRSEHTQQTAVSKVRLKRSIGLGRISNHLTINSIKDLSPPPDGGVRAWIQVLCAWFAIFNTWGFVNSFGAFQPFYESILPESASAISWIGSLQACLLFTLGMFSGRALDRGWFRPTVALGISIHLVGMFTLSLASSYWQLLLTQGLCTGVGGGIFFVPIMGLCSTYFSSHRGVALGIVTSGNSAGGIIYPVVVRELLPRIGFGWTVRVLGFINVASLALVLAFMQPRLPPRRSGPVIAWEAFKDVPYVLHVIGVCFLMPPVYCVFYYVRSPHLVKNQPQSLTESDCHFRAR